MSDKINDSAYEVIALNLISAFGGKEPNEEEIAESARVRGVDADKLNDSINRIISDERTKEQKAFDARLDELAMNHEFKPRPYSFKREMVAFEEIHRFLYSMMSDAIKMTGNYVKSLSVMEDQLTPAEYFTLEAFYNWIGRDKEDCPECEGIDLIYIGGIGPLPCNNCTDSKINKRTFGDNNYNERYKEWLLTLPRIELLTPKE